MAFSSQRPALSRRGFLFGASAAALGVGLGRGLFADRAFAQIAPNVAPNVSDAAWRDLSKRLAGPVLRTSDFDFEKFNLPYNLRYAQTRAAGIALCSSSKDVAQAILWCRENNVPLIARSGGHSYAGFSMTTGLMIDV